MQKKLYDIHISYNFFAYSLFQCILYNLRYNIYIYILISNNYTGCPLNGAKVESIEVKENKKVLHQSFLF